MVLVSEWCGVGGRETSSLTWRLPSKGCGSPKPGAREITWGIRNPMYNATRKLTQTDDRQQRKLRRNTQANDTTIETKLCVATIRHKPNLRSANAKLPHAKCLTKLETQQPHGCWIDKKCHACWRPHRPCGRRTTLTTRAAQQDPNTETRSKTLLDMAW